ncbi:class I SAM-dependent methyltransferase [Formosa maritima]|uniref:Methyltransferase domain-containing protein n=1 Tax=Formosa maritima TaxID=2592046 RepID=A0A5D0GD15_9FLAO|nr:class I SAM-dependent methyltransferase [Formosa maritima]TYA56651.1 methyltransferase domain-containing protein [Formosa maritima]
MKQRIKKYLPKFILKQYYSNINKRRYSGNAVECPICHSQFKIFKSYGVVERENAECLKCGSLERHRLLWKYLNEKLNFFEGNKPIKVLHFAPERIFFNEFIKSNNINYIPCDLYPEYFNYNEQVQIEKVDITSIPYEDNSFDFILCNHVLEHIPNDKLAMTELFRVMKPGGFGILQVPLDPNLINTYEDFTIITPEAKEVAFGQHDHVRVYGLDYKQRLENVGFKVCVDDFAQTLTKESCFKYGLIESEMIYKCSKEI